MKIAFLYRKNKLYNKWIPIIQSYLKRNGHSIKIKTLRPRSTGHQISLEVTSFLIENPQLDFIFIDRTSDNCSATEYIAEKKIIIDDLFIQCVSGKVDEHPGYKFFEENLRAAIELFDLIKYKKVFLVERNFGSHINFGDKILTQTEKDAHGLQEAKEICTHFFEVQIFKENKLDKDSLLIVDRFHPLAKELKDINGIPKHGVLLLPTFDQAVWSVENGLLEIDKFCTQEQVIEVFIDKLQLQMA